LNREAAAYWIARSKPGDDSEYMARVASPLKYSSISHAIFEMALLRYAR
jgi:hypothetical protein